MERKKINISLPENHNQNTQFGKDAQMNTHSTENKILQSSAQASSQALLEG